MITLKKWPFKLSARLSARSCHSHCYTLYTFTLTALRLNRKQTSTKHSILSFCMHTAKVQVWAFVSQYRNAMQSCSVSIPQKASEKIITLRCSFDMVPLSTSFFFLQIFFFLLMCYCKLFFPLLKVYHDLCLSLIFNWFSKGQHIMQTSLLFHCLLLILCNQSLYFLPCLENDNYKHPKANLFLLLQSFLTFHRIPDYCVLVGCTSIIVRNRYSVQQLQWEGEAVFTPSENT